MIIVAIEDTIAEATDLYKDARSSKMAPVTFNQITNNLADTLIRITTLFDMQHLPKYARNAYIDMPMPHNDERGVCLSEILRTQDFIKDMKTAVLKMQTNFNPSRYQEKLDKFLCQVVRKRLTYNLQINNEGFEVPSES